MQDVRWHKLEWLKLCHMTQVKLIKLKLAMALTNIQSDWMSNAPSALYNFYYTDSHLGVQLQVYI